MKRSAGDFTSTASFSSGRRERSHAIVRSDGGHAHVAAQQRRRVEGDVLFRLIRRGGKLLRVGLDVASRGCVRAVLQVAMLRSCKIVVLLARAEGEARVASQVPCQ